MEEFGFILTKNDKKILNPKLELLKVYRIKGENRPWRPVYLEKQ
jgi:hypothetical protein